MATKRPKGKAKPSTALAVVKTPKRQSVEIVVRDPRPLPAVTHLDQTVSNRLTEDADMGTLGLEDVKLTPLEEKVLNEPVRLEDVQVKPTGQPYLSHPTYTRWFNRAFGRLGWAIVPRSKPMKAGTSITCHYVLFIHGKPAASAIGEAEYHETNKEQTFGDVLEATVASALRRCAKRLGVGLELWDRDWLDAYIADHMVKVKTEVWERGSKTERTKWLWRKRTARPFWNEVRKGRNPGEAPPGDEIGGEDGPRGGQVPAPRPPASQAPAAGTHKDSLEPITQAQRQRLVMIGRNAGRDDAEVRAWLAVAWLIGSTKEIKRRDYDAICQALEKKGPLPPKREPGEEG